MLAPGKYYGHAVEAVLATTSTGKEQIAVVLEIDDPPGQRVTWYGFFTDATIDRTIESLRFLGWRGVDIGVFAYGNELPAEMAETVELVVENEADLNGVPRSRVRWINRASGPVVKNAMDAPAAAAFAQRMRAKLAAFDAKAGKAVAAPPKPAPRSAPKPAATGRDDEIPF